MRYQTVKPNLPKNSFKPNWHARIIALLVIVLGLSAWFLHKLTPKQHITEPVDILKTEPVHTLEPVASHFIQEWTDITVKRNDTMASIFNKLGLSAGTLDQISKLNGTTQQALHHLKPGQQLHFLISTDKSNHPHQLLEFHTSLSADKTLVIQKATTGFESRIEQKPLSTLAKTASAVISSSLLGSGTKAGIPRKILHQFIDIFNEQVDLHRRIRKGDQIRVEYQENYIDDKRVSVGPIIAAEFINKKHTYQVIRYQTSDGHYEYYTPEGKSLKTAFLRSPLKHYRISDHFSLHRKHPILGIVRPHKGTDFAAPTGTPIYATGNGRITFHGWKGGYGRVVIIQHGTHYMTVYGHMSRYAKAQKVGTIVKKGEIIGYVGMSGLATGPHTHYEFRVNGVAKNPETVKLPTATPLTGQRLTAFKAYAKDQLAKLEPSIN